MNSSSPAASALAPINNSVGPTTPRKGPPKFKQRQTRQFKSKPPKKGVKGFGDDIPGMEGLGTDDQEGLIITGYHLLDTPPRSNSEPSPIGSAPHITVICPWEAFNHLELHELAQFGII